MLPQAKFDSNVLACYTESAFIKEQSQYYFSHSHR
jgi:hypothetical protein